MKNICARQGLATNKFLNRFCRSWAGSWNWSGCKAGKWQRCCSIWRKYRFNCGYYVQKMATVMSPQVNYEEKWRGWEIPCGFNSVKAVLQQMRLDCPLDWPPVHVCGRLPQWSSVITTVLSYDEDASPQMPLFGSASGQKRRTKTNQDSLCLAVTVYG